MVLCDEDIERLAGEGCIKPYNPENLQPASYDVTLASTFRVYTDEYLPPHLPDQIIDPHNQELLDSLTKKIEVEKGKAFYIEPMQFALGGTVERVKIPANMVGRIEGRSSIGRLGLAVHITAGYIDPGFDGNLTLEFVNVAPKPIKLYPGMRIGQVGFMRMTKRARKPYRGRYQHDTEVAASRYGQRRVK